MCTFLCQESIKSAIDKAREALQYTGDDLTQLYHVFDESVREKYVNRDYVLTHFQEALDKRWIKPYYQMETRSKKSAPGPVLIFYMLNFYSNHQPARFSVEAA